MNSHLGPMTHNLSFSLTKVLRPNLLERERERKRGLSLRLVTKRGGENWVPKTKGFVRGKNWAPNR